MAAISTIATVAAAAIGAAGAISQGQAAKKQANFQAAVSRQQAERARQQAEIDEQDFRRDQSRQMARRRAIMGASGVESATGSPLLATEDFASEVELQALRIRNGGEVNATRLNQQAELQGLAGRNAARAGFMRAGSLLVQGGATAYGNRKVSGSSSYDPYATQGGTYV